MTVPNEAPETKRPATVYRPYDGDGVQLGEHIPGSSKMVPVYGTDGRYRVDDQGRVYGPRGELKPQAGKIGRRSFACSPKPGQRQRDKFIDVAVLESFAGEPAREGHFPEHINGDWTDDRLDNLRWSRERSCRNCGVPITVQRASKRFCEPCTAERKRPDRAIKRTGRKSKLKKYGLTLETYDALVEAREGRCDICGRRPVGQGGSLCVDHCHSTGRIRGLLCSPCNRAIGLLGDDAASLRRALDYLTATEQQGIEPHRRQDATFGAVNVYPVSVLERAFALS